MTGMRFTWPALIAAAFLLAHAGAAQAQIINPFGVNNGTALTAEDYKVARVAVGKLLDEPPAVGRYEDWSNPASGNKGKLTITDIFTRDSMPCRKVNSLIEYSKKGSAPVTLVLDTCKTSAGWKVVPND